jgi:phenylalanyl-tRNA synthetase beta chain
MDAIAAHPAPARRYAAFSRQPAMLRDLAVLVPDTLTAAEALSVIQASGGDWLESVSMFDRFAGAGIPAGQVSLGFSLIYRTPDRTLTAAELEPVHQRIIDQLSERCGAVLRT